MNNLHVYSAGCSWHGNISKVGKTADLPETTAYVGKTPIKIGGKGSGLPCCPHCGSMLFQIDEGEWWSRAEQVACPNYVRFLKWTEQQKRCWCNNSAAAVAYNASAENKDYQYNHLPFNE